MVSVPSDQMPYLECYMMLIQDSLFKNLLIILKHLRWYLLHCFGERKGEIHQCEEKKHQLFASSRCPDQEFLPSVHTQPGDDRPLDWGSHVPAHGMGTKPQPRHMPWMGIEPITMELWEDTPTNWATAARAQGDCKDVCILILFTSITVAHCLSSVASMST